LVRERKKLILILCALVCGATLMGYFTNGISGALSLGLSAAVVSAFVIYSFNKGQS
jgi:membrane associated rhomboid family serine protease